jgi:flavorubredoxin
MRLASRFKSLEEVSAMLENKYDYNNSIPITSDIYWVGYYDREAQLHCNPYLLIDEKDVVLFDPGSIPHFPIVMRKVFDLVNPKSISIIVASHQDPDLCGNLAVVEDVIERSDLKIAAHGNAVRLIRHYGIRSEFFQVEENDYKLTLSSGRVLEFIHTPYLHAPGAIMTYDSKTQSLFSSDIFGAVSREWTLFAADGYLGPMGDFHRIYMPSNKILKCCMENLANYRIDRILPQHGSILEGDYVEKAVQFLSTLQCGFDLLQKE